MRTSTGITGANPTTFIMTSIDIDATSRPMQDAKNIRVFQNGNVTINAPLSLA